MVKLHCKLQTLVSAGQLQLVPLPALQLVAAVGSLVKPQLLVESGENLRQTSNIDWIPSYVKVRGTLVQCGAGSSKTNGYVVDRGAKFGKANTVYKSRY